MRRAPWWSKGEQVRAFAEIPTPVATTKRVHAPDARVVVAVLDGRIIGSGSARIRDSVPYVNHARHAFLGFMYVVPIARGSGVNASIVVALAEWARSQGVTELVLEVYADNEPALRAYHKAGFQARLLEMRRSL